MQERHSDSSDQPKKTTTAGRARDLALKLLLLVATSLLGVFFLEIACRVYFFGADAFSVTKMNSVRHIGVSGHIQAAPYRDLIYELKPNLDAYHKLARLRTNDRGLQDKEYPLEAPPNTFRVAVVGDSYTMAEGVGMEDLYHSLLEDRFNRKRPERSWEFINFGVAGYNMSQYAATIRHRVLEYDPDLILIGFSPPDDNPADDIVPPEHYRVKPATRPFWRTPFLIEWLQINKVYRAVTDRRRASNPSERSREQEIARRMEYVDRKFADFEALSDSTGVPVIVAYLSILEERGKQVGEVATRRGLSYVNTEPLCTLAERERYYINKIDTHPNARAHAEFADRLYRYLTERWLPEHVESARGPSGWPGPRYEPGRTGLEIA